MKEFRLEWRQYESGAILIRGFEENPEFWVPFELLSPEFQQALIENGLPSGARAP